jgi:hypothetical protein
MDWQASIEDRGAEDRGAVITFRGLTRQSSPDAPLGDVEKWIEPGESWGGRSFEDWRAFLRERGGSVTVGFVEGALNVRE